MMDRRRFMTAMATMPFAMAQCPLPGGVTARALTIVIFDGRYAASREFARMAQTARTDGAAFDTRGDISVLWHRTLRTRLEETPREMRGLTLASDLFVLDRLAANAWFHVTHRVALSPMPSLIHWIIAPTST